jgi:hypothetical protein
LDNAHINNLGTSICLEVKVIKRHNKKSKQSILVPLCFNIGHADVVLKEIKGDLDKE